METPPHLLGRMLSVFFMDKGLWSFGTLLIGTPHAIAISGAICAVFALVLLYQQRQPRENLAAENQVNSRAGFEPRSRPKGMLAPFGNPI